ncbi:MAG TPA: CdaR family protein [Candidatus Binataceae bacterium]|nr:CdaR family protein [Candidatus Binataceae bacterium]
MAWITLPKITWSELKSRVGRNNGLRLISIAIAIALWVFVNASNRGFVENFLVQVSYRALPRGLVIMNQPPEFVQVDVQGSRTLLSLIQPERLTLRLEIANIGTGPSDIKINPASFNVPRGTVVTRVTPPDIILDIDRIVSREVPVHLNLDGQVATGYEMGVAQVDPASIGVTGPSRYVLPLDRLETAPFDLKDLAADTDRQVAVVAPAGPVTLAASTVDAKVPVAYAMGEKRFNNLNVEVRDIDYRFRVDPSKVSITLRGPVIKLSALDPRGRVYIDGKGVYPGTLDLPVQIDLPDGMQIVRQTPDKVKLKVYREKRANTQADTHTS